MANLPNHHDSARGELSTHEGKLKTLKIDEWLMNLKIVPELIFDFCDDHKKDIVGYKFMKSDSYTDVVNVKE